MKKPLEFLFDHEAVVEYLADNPLLQMTLAELVGHGASQKSVLDLVSSLMVCDNLDLEDERYAAEFDLCFARIAQANKEAGGWTPDGGSEKRVLS